jgi:hypothetical protein
MDRILEIGEYQIELMDEDLVPVTKSVYDVQDPNQRKSHFTKSIILPSSRVNNQVFSGYFDASMFISSNVQFDPFYNPTKKVKATYYEDSLPVITGYCQLVNINKTKELIEYELIIYGENADFFKSIEGRKMSDLDMSAYDHVYTRTAIRNSWTNASGYVYPQIKNGRQTDVMTSNGQLQDYWKVGDFDLWFFVKTLWDKIWLDAGFRYFSNFINTDTFKKLIYKGESSGMIRTETDIELSRISYDISTSGLFAKDSNARGLYLYNNKAIIFNTVLKDTTIPQYNTTTGALTLNTTNDYDISTTLQPVFRNSSGSTIPSGFKIIYNVYLIDDLGNFIAVFNQHYIFTSSLAVGASRQVAVVTTIVNKRLDATRSYKFCMANVTTGVEIAIDDSRFDIYLNKDYGAGDIVNVNSLLSTEMTQKDFVMGLVKMFNMYIEPYYFKANDPNSGGYLTYLIEPRDDYYTSEIIDWTYKIDYNKEFTVKPIGGAKEKFYKFTYDLDKDYHNNLYNQRTGRTFGDVTIDIQNDFLQGTKEVKIPFSLMVLASNFKAVDQQARPLPTDLQNDVSQGIRNDKSKPKILFYNGATTSDVWYFGDTQSGTGGFTTELQYPAASTYDTLTSPDYDLCFDTPQELYYTFPNGTINVTNQGLYNKFYKRGLEEVNNKNSKMLECYVNLTPFDVHNLSLRPIYEIDGNHYRLYEMSDYNGKETTKCTFLKLTPVDAVAKTSSTTRGGRGSGDWGTNPNLWKDTGNIKDVVKGGDLVRQTNVLTGGGVTYIPPDKDNLLMLQYRTINTTTDLILTGGEGSPLFIIVDTSTGNVDITMPIETLNIGKSYYIVKTSALNNLVIKYSDDTTFETITAATTSEYILTDSDIIKIR